MWNPFCCGLCFEVMAARMLVPVAAFRACACFSVVVVHGIDVKCMCSDLGASLTSRSFAWNGWFSRTSSELIAAMGEWFERMIVCVLQYFA